MMGIAIYPAGNQQPITAFATEPFSRVPGQMV